MRALHHNVTTAAIQCSSGKSTIIKIDYATATGSGTADGRLHREDSPAIEWANGIKERYLPLLEGKKLSTETGM